MIKSYRDEGVNDIRQGKNTDSARKLLQTKFWESAQFALKTLHTATKLGQIRDFQFLRLHKLKGKMKGWYSMSFSSRGRVIFQFDEEQGHAYDVFISPDHYGD